MSFFKSLPFEHWPEVDRSLWLRGVSRSHLLARGAVGGRWRDATKTTVSESYSYALEWLQRNALLTETPNPNLRWRDVVLDAYISDLQSHVSPVTAKQRVLNLERALAVMEPGSDREALRAAARLLKPVTNHAAKRDRLQDPGALLSLGADLMEQARLACGSTERRDAALFRDGLQIALLTRRPMRKSNFSSIELGRHLICENGVWWLRFPASEMKNHEAFEVTFPNELVPELEEYLAVFRPRLAGQYYKGDRLWIGYKYRPLAPHSIQLNICKRTEQAFGKPINPHLFRDCVATSIAIDDPVHIRAAPAAFGHRLFSTTQRHYNLARTVDAARTVSGYVDGLRNQARRRQR